MIARFVPVERQLLFGIVSDILIFLPKLEAERLASTWSLVAAAKTWGELRDGLPRDIVQELRDLYLNGETESEDVASSTLFDYEQIAGLIEEDWPEWPSQIMLTFLPKEIIQEFGRVRNSVLDSLCLTLDPSDVEDIIAQLDMSGFTTKEDLDTMMKACGHMA